MHWQGTSANNQTFYRLRLLVLIALTTGMRIAEIFALTWYVCATSTANRWCC